MDWRAKVELFEEIRREYEFGAGTFLGMAKKLGVHRRMMREALGNEVPARRKKPIGRRSPRWLEESGAPKVARPSARHGG